MSEANYFPCTCQAAGDVCKKVKYSFIKIVCEKMREKVVVWPSVLSCILFCVFLVAATAAFDSGEDDVLDGRKMLMKSEEIYFL